MSYQLRDGIEFMKSLPDRSVDGIFTDSPWGHRVSESSTGHRSKKRIIWGNENWLELIKETTDEGSRILKSNGRCLLWLGIRHVGPVCKIVDALEYRWMIFVRFIPPRYMATLESYFDAILYFAPFTSPWPDKIGGKCKPQEYFKASTGKPDSAHPCARPYRSVKEILGHWFSEGEYIVDPFAGSDTTGRAARELGLRWDSCEIDPKMYQTGIERHSQGILFEKRG